MNSELGPANYRVFYRDTGNGQSVPSSAPQSLPADQLAALADRVLVDGDNFLGVVDRNDLILQCYVANDPQRLTLELIYPEASGCLRLTRPRAQVLQQLASLPEQFDESLLEGAQYID